MRPLRVGRYYANADTQSGAKADIQFQDRWLLPGLRDCRSLRKRCYELDQTVHY
jgi:hypothetical protein